MNFELLIREVASRFNLGDKAPGFVRLLLEAMFDRDQGGIAGLRERFAGAGLGDLFASWIGTTPGDNVLQPDQFNSGLGEQTVNRLAGSAGIPAAAVNLAGAWLLPKIVGLLSKNGSLPATLPSDYERWFAGAPVATATPAAARTGGLGFLKWLIPLLLIIGAFLLFRNCQRQEAVAPPPIADTAAVATPAAEQGPPAFDFANAGGQVTVGGRLATEAEKTKLWDALVAAFGAGNVGGDITVDPATLPAGWLDRLVAILPEATQDGLKFQIEGDRLRIDTSGMSEDSRFAISQKLRQAFSGFEISGLWDRATAALAGLGSGFSGGDLVKALNLTNVYFDTGSATITRDSLEILGKAAEAIKAAPAGTRIEVGGHTDNTGDAAANMTLSEQRAEAVVAKLVELGVPADTLVARGFGQDKPIADNDTEEGRASNRRIEYSVLE